MRIEVYFQQVRKAIEASPIVQAFDIAYDKRSTYEGFIRGEIYFVDGSILHLREFIDAEINPERLTYVYQYMDSTLTSRDGKNWTRMNADWELRQPAVETAG